MKYFKRNVWIAAAALILAGCSGAPMESTESEQTQTQEVQNEQTEDNTLILQEDRGYRVPVSLEEAVLKKNHDEQFVVLYVKDDCSYCEQFYPVLDEWLESNPLIVYEVSLSEAEEMYTEEDKDAMLNILSGGVSRTPAMYYIESQSQVYLLDHSEENYSAEGLDQWVEAHNLLGQQK